MTTKKYILKPGRHQFAPGSHAVHENENLSDEEAQWYLKQYPHIAALFDTIPDNAQPATDTTETACRVSVEKIPPLQNTESMESPDQISETDTQKSIESFEQISEITNHQSV